MKVLLVEDSLTVRAYVEGILRSAPDITLLPAARDGATGVAFAKSYAPDVILMDLELPVLSGLEAIAEIMSTAPCPIVVLSGALDKHGVNRTFAAFQAGVVDVLAKPKGLSPDERARFGERLLRTLRVMSQARVLRRRSQLPSRPAIEPAPLPPVRYEVVCIGASTGGPQVLRGLLDALPAPFPLPILICQHIVPGFEHGLATWLAESGHRVHVVGSSPERMETGRVLVARADHHLAVRGYEAVVLPAVKGQPTPSVDVLFESVADSFGSRAVALLLSGMGEDGKRGLLALRERGALTVTQSAETCVIDGMPCAARSAGASVRDLSPSQMVELLKSLAPCAPRPGSSL